MRLAMPLIPSPLFLAVVKMMSGSHACKPSSPHCSSFPAAGQGVGWVVGSDSCHREEMKASL